MQKHTLEIFMTNRDVIDTMISNRIPSVEISRTIGVNYKTFIAGCKELGIVLRHNQGRKGVPRYTQKATADLYIQPNSKYINASKLRYLLIRDGYKEEKCERCGNSEWMGMRIPLELHHVNFNHYDNTLDNLQILCSNCHMQVHGFSNKRPPKPIAHASENDTNSILRLYSDMQKKSTSVTQEPTHKQYNICPVCGNMCKQSDRKYCSVKCAHDATRKGKPSDSTAIIDAASRQKSICGIAREFNVSDNAVRKWIKSFGIETEIRELLKNNNTKIAR